MHNINYQSPYKTNEPGVFHFHIVLRAAVNFQVIQPMLKYIHMGIIRLSDELGRSLLYLNSNTIPGLHKLQLHLTVHKQKLLVSLR
jgi:hypothetical protein